MQENTAKLCAKLSKNLKGCFYYEDTQVYVAESKQMNLQNQSKTNINFILSKINK